MANRVAWLSKRVKIGGQWFVRKPIIKTSGFITEKVVHDGPVHLDDCQVLVGIRSKNPAYWEEPPI